MFQIGDLIKDKDNHRLTRVAMVTKVDNEKAKYEYYMLHNPHIELQIRMDDAHTLCHVVQR